MTTVVDCGHRCCAIPDNAFHSHEPRDPAACARCQRITALVRRLADGVDRRTAGGTMEPWRTRGERAALTLLSMEGSWLRDDAFIAGCVRELPRGDAYVAWKQTRRYLLTSPCDEARREVLMAASELAQTGMTERLASEAVVGALNAGLLGTIEDAVRGALRGEVDGAAPACPEGQRRCPKGR